ncbi:hypothetical protein NL676_002550 [Syzygium grande]|nr:hypothetical protein NL676_002550 [Syzygium grande]
MADPEPRTQTQSVEYNERRLRYLDFVQMAVIYMVICFSTLYEFAKDNAGPLRPGVQTVEATVKAVVGPLCDRFQDVPFEILRFVDSKVDEYVHELDSLVPSLVKQASSQARAVASEVQRAGFAGAARSGCKRLEPAAREMREKYEPVAAEYAVAAWRRLNRLPLFPHVAEIAVPTVAYWADKYNRAVCFAAERGYPVSGYLPLVPLDRIAKAFDEAERGPAAAANGEVARRPNSFLSLSMRRVCFRVLAAKPAANAVHTDSVALSGTWCSQSRVRSIANSHGIAACRLISALINRPPAARRATPAFV